MEIPRSHSVWQRACSSPILLLGDADGGVNGEVSWIVGWATVLGASTKCQLGVR